MIGGRLPSIKANIYEDWFVDGCGWLNRNGNSILIQNFWISVLTPAQTSDTIEPSSVEKLSSLS
jgi:hypothetical protein